MRKYNENPKIFLGLCPKPHQGSALDLLGGSQHSPNPQLIIVIAARSFSQNSKKTDQLIFPCFDHCISPEPWLQFSQAGPHFLQKHEMNTIKS